MIEINDTMINYFNNRMMKHVGLVRKYCKLIAELYPEYSKELKIRGKEHDKSKYTSSKEYESYILINWHYKLLSEGKPGLKYTKKLYNSTFHHIKNNRHHPEFHTDKIENILDRNKPNELVDAQKMDDIDILEMIADWCAVSEERKTSIREWVNNNVDIRWKFTDKHKNLIYDTISLLGF